MNDFFWYPDPFLKRIRIRANDTDPTGSETLILKKINIPLDDFLRALTPDSSTAGACGEAVPTPAASSTTSGQSPVTVVC